MTDTTVQRPTISPIERFSNATGLDTRMMAMVLALIVIWLVFSFMTDGIFLTARNLYNLAVQSSVVGIIATGMVLVIIVRHIDLSVGSLLGFTGMLIAYWQVEVELHWLVALLLGLVVGGLVGVWQGYWIAYQKVPAFVVTLGGLLMFRGGAFLVTDGKTVAPLDETFQLLGGGVDGSIGATASWVLGLIAVVAVVIMTFRARARSLKYGFPVRSIGIEVALVIVWAALILGFVQIMNSYYKPRTDIPRGIPIPVLIMIGVVIVMSFIARMTKFGRYVFAMGGNPEAAELSGINVRRTTMMIFVIIGVLCAIAGVVTSARLNAGANSMGTLAELNVIAATVIGGTSLAGGVGTVPGAILGAVIIQSLENGMVLLGVSSAMRQVIIGLVLIMAVFFDVAYNRQRR